LKIKILNQKLFFLKKVDKKPLYRYIDIRYQ